MRIIDRSDTESNFLAAWMTPCRSTEIPESADAYGWLIGSWELDVLRYGVDVAALRIKGEAHFEWVLEGRAVQDIWIMPARSLRTAWHGQVPQYVWHNAPCLGPLDRCLAHYLDESCNGFA